MYPWIVASVLLLMMMVVGAVVPWVRPKAVVWPWISVLALAHGAVILLGTDMQVPFKAGLVVILALGIPALWWADRYRRSRLSVEPN